MPWLELKRYALLVVLMGCLGFGASADAAPVAVDFESLSCTPIAALESYGQVVTPDGFEFVTAAAVGGFASLSSGVADYTGSTAPFANEANADMSLAKVGGGEFPV